MFPHFDQSEYAVALKNAYRQFPAKDSTLDIDFINNRQRVAGVYGSALDGVTFTRSTTATYFGADGTLQTAAINAPRFEYDPVSLRPLGLLIEESRANSIRNNTMQGAATGTPGTLPTGWNSIYNPSGLSISITRIAVENGISTIDFRLTGTAVPGNPVDIGFTPINLISVGVGTWNHSCFLAVPSGTTTGISQIRVSLGGWTSGFSLVERLDTAASVGSTLSRFECQYTFANASVVTVYPFLSITQSSGEIDITLRIGLPQLESGAFASSVIATSGTSVIRGADVASMTGASFSSWYSQAGGTFVISAIPRSASGVRPIIQLDDGTGNEIISLRGNGADPELYVVDGGAVQAQIDAGTLTANTLMRMAASVFPNDCAVQKDGGAAVTDSVVALPTPNQLRLGSDGTNYFNGWIQRIPYFPNRLPDNIRQYLSRLL